MKSPNRPQVRAIDVIIGELWQRRKVRRVRAGKYTRLEAAIGSLADPAIFALSSGVIMFAWFFMPRRLPAYVALDGRYCDRF